MWAMTFPEHRQVAFDQAQRAFANGWIDMDDLDRRLALIAGAETDEQAQAAVSDLGIVEKRLLAHREFDTPATETGRSEVVRNADRVFLVMAAVLALNVLIWGVIALAGTAPYFWPVWLLIPLGATGLMALLARLRER